MVGNNLWKKDPVTGATLKDAAGAPIPLQKFSQVADLTSLVGANGKPNPNCKFGEYYHEVDGEVVPPI